MLIADLEKNQRERIRVSIEDYHDHRFIDCRVYYQGDTGTWRPTRKGIALNPDCLDDVIKSLKKAKGELEGR